MESSPAFESAQPVKPPAPYIGGKRNLARRLVSRIQAVPHLTYAEPFVGMGGVFLRRTARPRSEVVNDLSRDVATFYRVLQRHYVPFMDMLKWQITSRAEFERLVATDPATLTDLERAARFLYLQRLAFGGKVEGRSFGVSRHRPGRIDVAKLATDLDALHDRLSGVIVESLPWRQFLQRYDAPQTLFYLDPPYWGCEQDYGKGMFANSDFVELRDALLALEGRFILSLNSTPEVLQLFEGFCVEHVATSYGIAKGVQLPVSEVILTTPVSRP